MYFTQFGLGVYYRENAFPAMLTLDSNLTMLGFLCGRSGFDTFLAWLKKHTLKGANHRA
jgi:hypothetical protein